MVVVKKVPLARRPNPQRTVFGMVADGRVACAAFDGALALCGMRRRWKGCKGGEEGDNWGGRLSLATDTLAMVVFL